MEYLSVTQIAKKWGISSQRVRVLCRNGRIPGVEKIGQNYLIPQDAEKPQDTRIKTGKYVNEEKVSKRLESQLLKTSDFKLLKQCFDESPNIFYIINPDTYHFLYLNQAAKKILQKEQCRETCYKLLHDLDKPCGECLLKEENSNYIDYYYKELDKHFSLYIRPVLLNEIKTMAVTAIDISAEIMGREEVEYARQRYIHVEECYTQALVQNGIWTWEYDPKLRKSAICGVPYDIDIFDKDALINYKIVHPDYVEMVKRIEKKANMGVLHQQLELPIWLCPKEEYLWVRLVVNGIFEYDGKTVQKYVCTVRDISKERNIK